MESVLDGDSSEDGGAADDQHFARQGRVGPRVCLVYEGAGDGRAFNFDSPCVGDADLASAEDGTDFNHSLIAIDVRPAEIDVEAAENRGCFPEPEVLRGDPPLETAENDRLIEGRIVAFRAPGLNARGGDAGLETARGT